MFVVLHFFNTVIYQCFVTNILNNITIIGWCADICSQDNCSQDICSQDNCSQADCPQPQWKIRQLLTRYLFILFIFVFKQKQVITTAHEMTFKHTNNISPILLHHNLCITLLMEAETVLVKQPRYIQTKLYRLYRKMTICGHFSIKSIKNF